MRRVVRADRFARPAEPGNRGLGRRFAADLVGDREGPSIAWPQLSFPLRHVAVERPRDVAEDLMAFAGEKCRKAAAERAARGQVEQTVTRTADFQHHTPV